MKPPVAAILFGLCAGLCVLSSAGCGTKDEPNYGDQVARALQEGKASGARGDLQSLAVAITSYATNESGLPVASSIDELAAKLEPGYLKRVPRVDPWGTPYTFAQDGSSYKLTCAGVDKTFGTADDMEMTDGQVTKMPASYTRFQ